jgi:hypothetical protein
MKKQKLSAARRELHLEKEAAFFHFWEAMPTKRMLKGTTK